MSIPERILIRDNTACCNCGGIDSASCKMPSTRKRARWRLPFGSICRSEAPSLMPLTIRLFTKLTVGAPKASSLNRASSSPPCSNSCDCCSASICALNLPTTWRSHIQSNGLGVRLPILKHFHRHRVRNKPLTIHH